MNRSAEIMIHDPWALAIGNARDMRETADQLDKGGSTIASIYAARGGGDVEDWRNTMLGETWAVRALVCYRSCVVATLWLRRDQPESTLIRLPAHTADVGAWTA